MITNRVRTSLLNWTKICIFTTIVVCSYDVRYSIEDWTLLKWGAEMIATAVWLWLMKVGIAEEKVWKKLHPEPPKRGGLDQERIHKDLK